MASFLAPISLMLVVAASGVAPALAQPEAASPAQQQPAADTPALTEKEKALLQKIRALKAPRWRTFGSCRYDWTAWRLAPEAVRTTNRDCGVPPVSEAVAVHCATLKVSTRSGDQPWSSWRLPLSTSESSSSGGEDLMVAALCANAQPAAEPPAISTPNQSKPTTTAKPAAAKSPATSKPAAAPAKPQ